MSTKKTPNAVSQPPESEAVDGPKIVADILNCLQSKDKERLVKAIQQSDPQIALKIEESLFNFNDLLDLTSQSLQLLLQKIDYQDLVPSLKTAGSKVRDYIFQNMSARKRITLQEDLAALPRMRLTEVEEAQKRILTTLEKMRSEGVVRTQAKHDVWV